MATAINASTPIATPMPIPAFAPVERALLLEDVTSFPADAVEVAVFDAGDVAVVDVSEVVVAAAKSAAFQRMEIPCALIPSDLVVLDSVSALVNVHTSSVFELKEVHALCVYQSSVDSVWAA